MDWIWKNSYLSQNFGAKIIKKAKYSIDYKATEITNKFIIYAKNRKINIEKANLYKLPLYNESFDLQLFVFSINLLILDLFELTKQ